MDGKKINELEKDTWRGLPQKGNFHGKTQLM
jgi:hypothetical protein